GLNQLKKTCTVLFVTGMSMGGTLTLHLAQKYPEIAGIMPINAGIHVPRYIKFLQNVQPGDDRFLPGIGSDIKAEGIKERAYDQTPVQSLRELVILLKLVREDLHKVRVPTLIFSSIIDHVIPSENGQEIYDRISSNHKEIVRLENSFHVALLDND